jgi:putative cardiolipin synthase
VRIYNPYPNRGFKALGYVTEFKRLNRRMHNKSFTADAQLTIVGGRNVGNEYFAAGDGTRFVDLDVVAAGRMAAEVGGEFDLYWNSGSAYPARLIIDREPAVSRAEFAARARAIAESPATRTYAEAISRTPQGQALLERRLPFEWTAAQVVHDDPEKTLDLDDEAHLQLLPKLIQFFGPPMKELDLVSPYFVPGKFGTEALGARNCCGRGCSCSRSNRAPRRS